jgi:hypothetical protein
LNLGIYRFADQAGSVRGVGVAMFDKNAASRPMSGAGDLCQ